MDALEQITALREKLRYHNDKYYNQDAPEISDYEYDMMQRELRALEAAHPEYADADSPTQRVGVRPLCQGYACLSARESAGRIFVRRAFRVLHPR